MVSRKKRQSKETWETGSRFTVDRRIDEMGEQPSWKDINLYGVDKEDLMLTSDEQEEAKNDIKNLKITPYPSKVLKNLGLRSIRTANEKVRVHFKIDEQRKIVTIKEIEFRAKLYRPFKECLELVGDELFLLCEGQFVSA